MKKDLAQGPIGTEAKYDVDLNNGNIMIKADYDGKGANAGVYVEIESDYFMDMLAAKIPGEIDDTVFAIIKSALKG